MGFKEFIEPDWKKILISVVFVCVTFFYVQTFSDFKSTGILRGLPFPYYACYMEPADKAITNFQPYCTFALAPTFIPYIWLILDLLVWYLVACVYLALL